jgi:fatty acid desaturase
VSQRDGTAIDAAMGTEGLPGRELLDKGTLQRLSERSDGPGLRHLAVHAIVILATGLILHEAYAAGGLWPVPALILHGFALVTLFAPMHEAGHTTAFRSLWLGKAIAWMTGAVTLNNADYYRRYHHWHHRYTQVPGQDPELGRGKPGNWPSYLWRLAGFYYYADKLREMWMVATDRMDHLPYVPARARSRLVWSMRLMIGLYLLIAAAAIAVGSWTPITYWLLPMLCGQPILRAILLAEHTGCSEGRDGLTNTRTTLASWPIRFMMWNMPFHAEHHLHPAVPFHRLPELHRMIRDRLEFITPGYPAAQREMVAAFGAPRSAKSATT